MRFRRLSSSLLALAVMASLSFGNSISSFAADENPSKEGIAEALKPKKLKTRGFNSEQPNPNAEKNRQFIDGLAEGKTRQITVEERKEVAKIVKENDLPSIDLVIYFEFDSATPSARSLPTLTKLAQVLSSSDFKGTTILIGGHTDAKGADEYNLDLSQRRANAVRDYLSETYGLHDLKLLPIGYGEEQLKNTYDPLSGENRRVQITNMTQY